MKRSVQIYIEGERLELFNDEKISINSTVQNINDISKTYTDFSQSFTVPASKVNNQIFQHFYENSIDSTLDYNIRRSASIEIDLIPFRTGKIQLEKAQLKNGNVDNYQITFYGDLVTLKDLFGEDKLTSLDYSSSTFVYSGANVQTRINSDATDYDVRFPLISSSRVWQYGGSGSNDISQTSGHIHYSELFPALRISKIFDAIENKYGIDFTGSFLTNKRFTDVFLYLKNRETFDFWTQSEVIDLNAVVSTGISTPQPMFNLTNNKIVFTSFPNALGGYAVYLNVTSTSPTTRYIVDVYENNILINSFEYIGTDTKYVYYLDTDPSLYKEIEFKIKANQSCTVTHANIQVQYDDAYGAPTTYNFCSLNSTTLTANVDLSYNMPDMKVSDFFSGILKQFNLACIPTTTTSYEVINLETWYAIGTIRDITKYIDKTESSIDRMALYKKISFEYEQSQSFMNRKFFDFYAREYGDLSSNYVYDGSDYVIKLPFENLEFNKFTGSNIQVGYCLTKEPDFKPYIPKPILLYKYNKLSCSFHFNDGTSTNHILNYIPFGQDLLSGGINYSLNFGNDQSTLLNQNIERGIYSQYYSQYLNNLYNTKNRLVTLKANLPISVLSTIKLNDRLVVRDKRYIINNMQIDLTSGDVSFQLIQDFRSLSTYTPK